MRVRAARFAGGDAAELTDDTSRILALDCLRLATGGADPLAPPWRRAGPGEGEDELAGRQQQPGADMIHALPAGAEPYYLFLTRLAGFSECCLYVQRRPARGKGLPRAALARLEFDRDLFDGTVFSGLMLPPPPGPGGRWTFLADDLLALRGAPLPPGLGSLAHREETLRKTLERSYHPSPFQAHALFAKRFHSATPEGLAALLREGGGDSPRSLLLRRAGRDGRRRGAVDLALPLPGAPPPGAGTGPPPTALAAAPHRRGRFPPPEEREVAPPPATPPAAAAPERLVLRLRQTDLPDVYDAEEGRPVAVPDLALSAEIRAAFAKARGGANIAWECEWHPRHSRWVPVRGGIRAR